MSKISDEIRNWCDFEDGTECGGFVTKASFNKLLALADRIDSEMVELPKDRDGVPIHISDVVWDVDKGIKLLATSITLYANGVTKVDASCEGCHVHTSPSDFSHTRPDSFERIAEELDEQAGSLTKDGYTWQEYAIHDFADRIRKLAEKEDER